MSDDRSPLIERLFERTARFAGGGRLHPLEVLAEVERAASASVREGMIANQVTVVLNERDFAGYEHAFDELRREIDSLLGALEARLRCGRVGDRRITFQRGATLAAGEVRVEARFADTEHRPPPSGRPATTQRIELHGGVSIVLGDGTSAALSHTPFSIGRAPANDLVLLSMAVSRNHARVVHEGDGFVIEDAGSRNGLVVDGSRQSRVALGPGLWVHLGDIELSLERDG